MNPLKDLEEEDKPPPTCSAYHLDPHDMDRAIVELRDDLRHERDRRYALTYIVRQHRKNHETERAKDRAEHVVAQLKVDRDVRSLV